MRHIQLFQRGWPLLVLIIIMGWALIRWHEPATTDGDPATITVYSGRSEDLIHPLIQQFETQTGIRVNIRYGQTAEMAATILEEGRNSPADIFFAQDAGALGALAHAGRLQPLPADILDTVEPRFRSPAGQWVGLSGRARVVVYNTDRVTPDALPASLDDLTGPAWRGRVGWAPQNGSFQAFVTGLRVQQGDTITRAWLIAMRENGTRAYTRNTSILSAVAAGEVDTGLVNHYYLHAMQQQGSAHNLKNHYPSTGVLINVAGAGIVDTSQNQNAAEMFIRFLLSTDAQTYFTTQTFEYPLRADVPRHPDLPPLHLLSSPDLDLSDLDDLEGTLRLLQDTGVL